MTHIRFGYSHVHPAIFLPSGLFFTFFSMDQLTNTRSSDGTPDPDGKLKEVSRIKIRHYRNLYLNRPDPIDFIPLDVDTTRHLYDELIRLLLFHTHRDSSDLVNELSEESDQFRFLRTSCFANLKGDVGLIMVKSSTMWIFPRTFPSTFCLSDT
jgi:hypothetical protein